MTPSIPDALPPHSPEAERSVLRCILDAGISGSQSEVENLLLQVKERGGANLFFEERHRNLYAELTRMRMGSEPHAVSLATVDVWLTTNKLFDKVGGKPYWLELTGQLEMFTLLYEHLHTIHKLAIRRWALAESARIGAAARNGDIDLKQLRMEFGDAMETLDRAKDRLTPVIETLKLSQIKAYVPDPKTFLIGADMISAGEFSIIAGLPEAGKSMLANTLAFAGCRGTGTWMGYDVRRKFRTFVLQSEGSIRRMQKEFQDASADAEEFVRFTKPCHMAFSDPSFRRALRQQWEQWPFDLLIIDNWSDCVADDKFADYQVALDNVRAAIPAGDQMPAVLIVAHLSKAVIKSDKPLTGRALMAHVSGSFRIGQKARTCFTLVRANPELNDDDVVIFDCAKSNNDQPMERSAWHRRPIQFTPRPDFDWEEWLNPPEGGRYNEITVEDMRKLLVPGRQASKSVVAGELKSAGFSNATVYRALGCTGKYERFKAFLVDNDGLLSWKE